MNQREMFTDIPAEKRKHKRTKKTQRIKVLALVERHPASTSAELAAKGGLCRYSVASRLVDLHHKGAVLKGMKTRCRISGIKSFTWHVRKARR